MRTSLRDDISRFGQCDLGDHRSDKLIDEHAEENGVSDDAPFRLGKGGECHQRHAEGHACLRNEREAEIFADLRVCAGDDGAGTGTEILTDHADDDVHDADENVRRLLEEIKAEICARKNEEKDVDRHRPLVGLLHDFGGVPADVAENGAEHHAG